MPTAYINADIAGDGDHTIVSSSPTYSTARAGNGTFTYLPYVVIGTDYFDSVHDCYQSFLSFDTSAIASNSSISNAWLSLFIENNVSTINFTVKARRKTDWSYNLVSTDFVPGSELSSLTTGGAVGLTPSSLGWIDIPLNSATVSPGGTTKILVYESGQESSTASLEERYAACSAPGTASQMPQLVFDYEEGTTSPTGSYTTLVNGLWVPEKVRVGGNWITA